MFGSCHVRTARTPTRPAFRNIANIHTGFTPVKKKLLHGVKMLDGATPAKTAEGVVDGAAQAEPDESVEDSFDMDPVL